jgi:hypothetical protein
MKRRDAWYILCAGAKRCGRQHRPAEGTTGDRPAEICNGFRHRAGRGRGGQSKWILLRHKGAAMAQEVCTPTMKLAFASLVHRSLNTSHSCATRRSARINYIGFTTRSAHGDLCSCHPAVSSDQSRIGTMDIYRYLVTTQCTYSRSLTWHVQGNGVRGGHAAAAARRRRFAAAAGRF